VVDKRRAQRRSDALRGLQAVRIREGVEQVECGDRYTGIGGDEGEVVAWRDSVAWGARGLEATGSRLAVVSDPFHPAQYEIGDQWYRGRLGVAEEHRATGIVSAVAMGMPPTPVDRPVRAGARCILSGIGSEQHVVGLQLLALALITFAVARPFSEQIGQKPVQAILLLDASAGMQAQDVQPSRFARAVDAARSTLSNLPDNSLATAVVAKWEGEKVAAPDASMAEKRLGHARDGDEGDFADVRSHSRRHDFVFDFRPGTRNRVSRLTHLHVDELEHPADDHHHRRR